MYFPIGWPKILRTPELTDENIIQVVCNRDKILFVVLTDDTISVWFTKPCVLIVHHRRDQESLEKLGSNTIVEWKPDSTMLAVVTVGGHLILYDVSFSEELSRGGVYQQNDPPQKITGPSFRYRWDGTLCDGECALDLSCISFYYGGTHCGSALPAPDNAYVIDMEYSPLIGGFAIVMNDGRAMHC
ncbi:guanine nucleotide exchange factor subunit Rich-like [Ctenocephalides felis]|uniref:guanine nucleotide exchange factor subunit Rich-like n=1 Tax=Ctenocephalides felis TaxID=7515 RepID=UPI000E6E18B9|nr:guanine nucleotide exchange factor subunit Rich-like [Ctenocephalides felis]